jgi:hypothetical protein
VETTVLPPLGAHDVLAVVEDMPRLGGSIRGNNPDLVDVSVVLLHGEGKGKNDPGTVM